MIEIVPGVLGQGLPVRAKGETVFRQDSPRGLGRRFVADASHELRAPLAVLRGETDLALRRERGLSQSELAAALAAASGRTTITREEVYRWEHDRRIPTPYWLSHLAAVLHVPTRALRPSVPGPWPDDAGRQVAITDVVLLC